MKKSIVVLFSVGMGVLCSWTWVLHAKVDQLEKDLDPLFPIHSSASHLTASNGDTLSPSMNKAEAVTPGDRKQLTAHEEIAALRREVALLRIELHDSKKPRVIPLSAN